MLKFSVLSICNRFGVQNFPYTATGLVLQLKISYVQLPWQQGGIIITINATGIFSVELVSMI